MDKYIHVGKINGVDYQFNGKDVSNVISGKIQHGDNNPVMIELKRYWESKWRIAELKKLLANSDYISCKIAEGAATREEYADIIAQRQAWRNEINQLET